MKNNKDKIMEKRISHILMDYKFSELSLSDATTQILSLLGESEIGVLDAESEHGGLLDVIERNASDSDTTKDSQHTNDGTLSKRIEAKEFCVCVTDGWWNNGYDTRKCLMCGKPIRKTVDS